MNKVFNLIHQRIEERLSTLQTGTVVAVYIAGPIDEDYDPKIRDHHWEVATLVDVGVLGLAIDLDRCEMPMQNRGRSTTATADSRWTRTESRTPSASCSSSSSRQRMSGRPLRQTRSEALRTCRLR